MTASVPSYTTGGEGEASAICSSAPGQSKVDKLTSVGNVTALRTGRAGVVNHRLEHLSRCNNRLSSEVCFANHVLLCQKDLTGWNFHAKLRVQRKERLEPMPSRKSKQPRGRMTYISTSHHDSI